MAFIPGFGGYGIEEDFPAQIRRLAEGRSNGTVGKACLEYYLNRSPSYVFCPYAVSSTSQWLDTVWGDSYLPFTDPAAFGGHPDNAYGAGSLLGCENILAQVGQIADFTITGQRDLTAAEQGIAIFGPLGYDIYDFDDDGVSRLSGRGYHILREGIERFFITDINNPAAGAKAQSSIFMMWDAFATMDAPIAGGQTGAVGIFNHIPGGSNVLYLDGHVEYQRYGTKAPVLVPPLPAWGAVVHNLTGYVGGSG